MTSAVEPRQVLNEILTYRGPFSELPEGDRKLIAEEFCWRIGFAKHSKMWFGCQAGVVLDKVGRWSRTERILEAIAKDGSEPPRSVYIAGKLGNGKTGWLAAMAKAWLLRALEDNEHLTAPAAIGGQFHRIGFMTHIQFIDLIHQEYREQKPSGVLKRRAEVEVLCFDDFATAQETEHNVIKLESLIDYRNRHDLTTWITSNVSLKDISKRPGWERMASRLSEHQWMVYHEIAINDRRKERCDE